MRCCVVCFEITKNFLYIKFITGNFLFFTLKSEVISIYPAQMLKDQCSIKVVYFKEIGDVLLSPWSMINWLEYGVELSQTLENGILLGLKLKDQEAKEQEAALLQNLPSRYDHVVRTWPHLAPTSPNFKLKIFSGISNFQIEIY